jgi:phage FluMu protein Com
MKPIRCPECHDPLFKDLALTGEAAGTFSISGRCPKCKTPVVLKVETEIVAHIFVNGTRQGGEESTGGDIARIL